MKVWLAALLACSAMAQTPTLVQRVSQSATRTDSVTGGGSYKFWLPNTTLAGNAIGVCATYATVGGNTVTVTDDQSNTYTNVVSVNQATDSQTLAFFLALNATAGARHISVNFSQTTGYVEAQAMEFYNIATSSAVDASSSNTGSGTSITAGSLGTLAASGDAIVHCGQRTGTHTATGAFTVGSQSGLTWALMNADVLDGLFSQWGVYSTTTALNPTMTMSGSTTWASVAVALKAASAGTAPAAGIRVLNVMSESIWTNTPTTQTWQFPTLGTTRFDSFSGGVGWAQTAASDSDSHTWSAVNALAVNDSQARQWCYDNATANNALTVTGVFNTTANWHGTVVLYDITGATTTACADAAATSQAVEQFSTTGTDSGPPSTFVAGVMAPTHAPGLLIVGGGVARSTVSDVNVGFIDAGTFTGEPPSGPSAVYENNPFMHAYLSTTGSRTLTWTYINDPSFNCVCQWAMAGAFLRQATIPSGGGSTSVGASTTIGAGVIH